MGKDGIVEVRDAAAPQIGRDHVFAHVDLRLALHVRHAGKATGVDKHGLAVGKHDQQAIALADVDGRYLQRPRLDIRRPWLPANDGELGERASKAMGTPRLCRMAKSEQDERTSKRQTDQRGNVPIRQAGSNLHVPSCHRFSQHSRAGA